MLTKEKPVQGIGIYAEFRKPGQTMQILITPDAYSNAGRLAPMGFVRRIVTPHTPKKQWQVSPLRNAEFHDLAERIDAGFTIADSEKEKFAETRMRHATSYFDNVLAQGWTMEKKPILIEMSRYDADDILASKTPNKMLYRVHISRKALDFPSLV